MTVECSQVTPHRAHPALGDFSHGVRPTFLPSVRVSTGPHLSGWTSQERLHGVPLP